MRGDEEFYGKAASEIAERRHDRALMAKAFALAMGDQGKTHALYICMRVEQLKEEAALAAARAVTEQRERQRGRLGLRSVP
jgi:hypothetical protein